MSREELSLNEPQLQLWLLRNVKWVRQQNRHIQKVVTQGSFTLIGLPDIT